MEQSGYWYVFFTKTGHEQEALNEIKAIFHGGEVEVRQLFIETFFKRHGEVKREIKPAFPGYLFVISSLRNDEFILRLKECIYRSDSIIRILYYGDTNRAALYEEERMVLEQLWMDGDCLGALKGMIEGKRVKILEGAFAGKESLIKKINRHKMQAIVEFEFMGLYRQMTVGLNIIRKVD